MVAITLNEDKNTLPTALIFDVPIFSGHYSTLLKKVHDHLLSRRKEPMWWLTTPNAEQIVLAGHDDVFRSCLTSSTLAIPDGASLVISSWLLAMRGGYTASIRERISGVDLMADLVAMGAEQGKKVMLLGGKAATAERATAVVRSQYSGVSVEQDPGAVDIRQETKAEKQRVMGKIRAFKPDMLFVGYGAPWQEQWIADNCLELSKNGVKIVMGVGGAFAMIAGTLKRAPVWMREAGLEWLWRLVQEPWRWKRQARLFTYWGMVGRELFRVY